MWIVALMPSLVAAMLFLSVLRVRPGSRADRPIR
jgi:hypothetical protein